MVRLLDEWSLKWKQKGRIRAVGLGTYEKYCTPGLYAHGGTSGISRASNDENACRAINHFLRARFPGKTGLLLEVEFGSMKIETQQKR